MGADAVKVGSGEQLSGPFERLEYIQSGFSAQVAALEQDRGSEGFHQGVSGAGEVFLTADGLPQQGGGLVHIGSNEVGLRKQCLAVRRHGILLDQAVTTGGDHDRVDD